MHIPIPPTKEQIKACDDRKIKEIAKEFIVSALSNNLPINPIKHYIDMAKELYYYKID